MKLTLDIKSTENRLKHLHYGSRIQPARDWLILIAVCVVLLAASIVFNVLLFVHVEEGDLVGSGVPVSHSGAPASLQKVETLFINRKAEKARYDSLYRFVDPSLPGS